jgi:hypothetical protein
MQTRPLSLASAAVLLCAADTLRAQTCYHQGSMPVPAQLVASPLPLGCPGAPDWPAWHLFTPAHRAPAPHAGFNPGDACPLPRLIVVYHCTGLLLLPVLPVRVHTMGYVIDQPELACAGTT